MFNQFDAYIQQLINDFAGTIDYNKKYFSENVLPLINKNWKLVCLEDEGMPCLNCYAFGNGIDKACLNCELHNQNMKFYMSFDDYKYMCAKEKYKTFEQFINECNNLQYTLFKMDLNQSLKNHPILAYHQILEIV